MSSGVRVSYGKSRPPVFKVLRPIAGFFHLWCLGYCTQLFLNNFTVWWK